MDGTENKAAERREQGEQISRREFLKLAAVLGGSAFLGSVLGGDGDKAYAQSVDTITRWDDQTDVIVVGYGGAGAAAAISAHDAGARVLLLEKMAKGGGSTAVSGGGYLCPNDADQAITYAKQLFKLSHSNMDEALVVKYMQEAVKNDAWIRSLAPGAKTMVYGGAGYSKLEGAGTIKKYMVTGKDPGAVNLWRVLSGAVQQRARIKVMLETPVKRLLTGSKGEIVGVVAKRGGRELNIKAKKGVILTCGGFEWNADMLRDYAKGSPIFQLCNPGNTGDGILMAQAVGAGLWHMTGLSCPLGVKVPEFDAAFPLLSFLSIGYEKLTGNKDALPAFFIVDKFGKRFVNERGVETHAWNLAVDYFDDTHVTYSRIPCYIILDEKARRFGPIASNGLGYNFDKYTWSADNLAEIEKGWILKGNSIAELAVKIKAREDNEGRMSVEVLQQTTETYNRYCEAGKDLEFDRAPNSLVPVKNGPFYAVPAYPCLLNTQGGPRRNDRAEVLNAFGEPIRRLYSAGELGSMWGAIYQGAGNIGECLAYGRIAGANAAANSDWDA